MRIIVFVTCLALTAGARAQLYNYDWLTPAGGTGFEVLSDSALLSDGSVVITGRFQGPAVFGRFTLPGSGSTDAFLARIGTDGAVRWALALSGPGFAMGHGVAADTADNVWVVGEFSESLSVGGTTLTASGSNDAFVARFDAAGSLQFARQFGGGNLGNSDQANAVDVDAAGNAYVAGDFRGTVTIAGETFTSFGEIISSVLLIKYAPDGTPLWARNGRQVTEGSVDASVRGLATDDAGNTVIAGGYSRSIRFGDTTLDVGDRDRGDLFVAEFTADGSLVFALGSGGPAFEVAERVRLGPDGDIYVQGDVFEFNATTTVFGAVVKNWWVARLDSVGRPRWVHGGDGMDSSGFGRRSGLAVEGDGSLLLGGDFRSVLSGRGVRLPRAVRGPYSESGFLIRYGSTGVVESAEVLGDYAIANIAGLELDGTSVVLAGRFRGRLELDGLVAESLGSLDAFVARGVPRLPRPEPDAYGDDEFDLGTLGEHEHWRCSRATGNPDRPCPGVFENGRAPFSAEDVFRRVAENATLADEAEVDRFRFSLPDITDAALGDDHADIRPARPPFRADAPEPLAECHAVEREAFGLPARDNDIYVTTAGTLTVRVWPTAHELAAAPVSLAGERIRLYAGSRLLDDIAVTSTSSAAIDCPMDLHELRDLRITFGERETPRRERALGGYTLEVEYRIVARRGIPDWALAQPDEQGLAQLFPAGCAPGAGRGFPFCGREWGAPFETPHPRLPRPDCIADGPGCLELTWFEWDSAARPLDVLLRLPPDLAVRVLDVEQREVAAVRGIAGNDGRPRPVALQAELEAGLYFLEVTGPPSSLAVLPAAGLAGLAAGGNNGLPGDDAGPKEGLGRLAFMAMLAALVIAVFLVGWLAVGLRRP